MAYSDGFANVSSSQIHREDWHYKIQVSNKLSAHTTELGKKLQNSNRKTDGFIKLLMKDKQELRGTAWTHKVIIIFMIFV